MRKNLNKKTQSLQPARLCLQTPGGSLGRMNPSHFPAALGALSFAFASSLTAQTLVQYDFTSSRSAVTFSSATVSATSLSAGPGVQAIGGQQIQLSSATGAAKHIFLQGNQVDEAISASSTDYIQFTLSATSGNVLNLGSISFDHAFNYSGSPAATQVATFEVRSSLDGYASSIGSGTSNPVSGTTPSWTTASIGLSALPYQGLSTITFRIYFNDGDNALSTSYLRLDNLTVTANAIPEPSAAAALAGLCGLGLAAARRRRRAD